MGILLFLAKVYGDDIHIYSCSRIIAFMDYSRVWVDLFSMDTVCVDNYSHERLEGFRIWDMESGTEYFILKRIEKGDRCLFTTNITNIVKYNYYLYYDTQISARMSYRHHCMIISGLSLVKDLTEDELKGLLQEITTITDSEEE